MSEGRQLIILAGGLGTRLKQMLGDLPKPMIPVSGKPLIQRQIESAKLHNFTDIHLLTYYKTDVIQEALGDGSQWGVSIRYHVESTPRGTGGALLDALPDLSERFVVLYGDTLFDVNLSRMWEMHAAKGADVSLFLHPNDHPIDSDLVEVDPDGWVKAFHPHPHQEGAYRRNLVNAALYVVDKSALTTWSELPQKYDLARDLFPGLLKRGTKFYGYVSREYIKDVGTLSRLKRAEKALESGLVESFALSNPLPAVFFDRDGTLNLEVNRVSKAENLQLLPGAGKAIRRVNQHGMLAVIVTNQPVVARGDCTFEELERIHGKLEEEISKDGAYLDRIFYCPHHPHKGYPGERPELKMDCDCRKPGIGMFQEAQEALNIDLTASWMIGDSTVDILSAHKAGVKSILVKTGHAGKDGNHQIEPDFIANDVESAVQFIVEGFPKLKSAAANLIEAHLDTRFVVIGGLAMSGKSTLAQALKEVYRMRNRTAHVIPLDSWLKDYDKRGTSGVLSRYDLGSFEGFVGELIDQRDTIDIELSHYDRNSRRQIGRFRSLSIGPDDVIIIEGVPALLVKKLKSISALLLYYKCDEEVRRKRFRDEYLQRGYEPDAIEQLYHERDKDENSLIAKSFKEKEVIIFNGDDL